jgi:hypothetical protein
MSIVAPCVPSSRRRAKWTRFSWVFLVRPRSKVLSSLRVKFVHRCMNPRNISRGQCFFWGTFVVRSPNRKFCSFFSSESGQFHLLRMFDSLICVSFFFLPWNKYSPPAPLFENVRIYGLTYHLLFLCIFIAECEAAVSRCLEWFSSRPRSVTDCIILSLPSLQPEHVDAVQKKFKPVAVSMGLMVGEFHMGNTTRGIRSKEPSFLPLRSVVPMLAFRNMVPGDAIFLMPSATEASFSPAAQRK